MSADPLADPSFAQVHWPPIAQVWTQIGPPLRLSSEDTAAYFQRCQEWAALHGAPRVLLLGVTPEIYRLQWPPGHDFLAVDQSAAMIAHVWPGAPEQVLRADWRELPLPAASRDLALCDGGLILLDPCGQRQFVDRLHAVVAPGGRCIFRLFVLPTDQETPETVLAELLAGRVPNLNVLKLRLAMAMQISPEAGVGVHAVWSKLREVAGGGGWADLAGRVGWTVEHLSAIDAYYQSAACYHFLSEAATVDLFCGAGRFVFLGARTGAYPLAERCPMVVFERR